MPSLSTCNLQVPAHFQQQGQSKEGSMWLSGAPLKKQEGQIITLFTSQNQFYKNGTRDSLMSRCSPLNAPSKSVGPLLFFSTKNCSNLESVEGGTSFKSLLGSFSKKLLKTLLLGCTSDDKGREMMDASPCISPCSGGPSRRCDTARPMRRSESSGSERENAGNVRCRWC